MNAPQPPIEDIIRACEHHTIHQILTKTKKIKPAGALPLQHDNVQHYICAYIRPEQHQPCPTCYYASHQKYTYEGELVHKCLAAGRTNT